MQVHLILDPLVSLLTRMQADQAIEEASTKLQVSAAIPVPPPWLRYSCSNLWPSSMMMVKDGGVHFQAR